ncbi:MAG: rhodanese-like domain-containing protein [Bacteroidia bacterium]
MLGFIKKLMGSDTDYKELVSRGAVIIDVRTPAEFQGGHIKGSINIPVDKIKNKVSELKSKGKPVITVCRSGSRSSMAKGILKSAGIEAYNGGPWNSLRAKI